MRPMGAITRGTTNPNRLRRCARWLAGLITRERARELLAMSVGSLLGINDAVATL